MALGAGSASAQGPYEPNDDISTAAGPLEAGGSYLAAVERLGDRDFYFFYVTAPGSAVSLTATNEGGGEIRATLNARLVSSLGTPLGQGVSFLRKGETRAETVTLEPGKYFVEVTENDGFGDDYRLVPGGGEGAFGPFAQIAANCETATSKAAAAEAALRRAEGKLIRAKGSYWLSRYGYESAKARRRARRALLAAKAKVRLQKTARRAAVAAKSPWCGIAS
ncbi:MAG: hypothetical protein ACTHN7_03935 [Solirubrobacterales bacterium]